MSQSDLAHTAGITRSAVNNYEAGKSEPGFETLCVFSRVLGVEIDELLSEMEPNHNYVRKMQVTDEESALLQAYREAEETYQGVALKLLRDNKRKKG